MRSDVTLHSVHITQCECVKKTLRARRQNGVVMHIQCIMYSADTLLSMKVFSSHRVN